MRRVVIFGLVVIVGGVLLLFGREWSSTSTPTPIPEKSPTPQLVVEPAIDRAESARVKATAPTTTPATPSTDSGTFRGRVVDAVTRQPVPEFEVQLMRIPTPPVIGDEPKVAQTFQSTDGRFAWQRAPAGKWNVTVTASRYQP